MARSWWRRMHLEEGQTAVGGLGRFELGLRRHAREWWIWHRSAAAADACWSIVESAEEPPAGSLERHVFRRTGGAVVVHPKLADRPVVARLSVPLSIPPGEEVTIHVGTPIWAEVTVEDPAVTLLNTPLDRPSDTWFGPSTREGELCYATRTRARIELDSAPPSQDRALTSVRIRNRSPETLRLSRLSLPVPYLSLFRDSGGGLWTESTTLDHRELGELAQLDIEEEPGADRERMTEPRTRGGRGTLVRAFDALFGPQQGGSR